MCLSLFQELGMAISTPIRSGTNRSITKLLATWLRDQLGHIVCRLRIGTILSALWTSRVLLCNCPVNGTADLNTLQFHSKRNLKGSIHDQTQQDAQSKSSRAQYSRWLADGRVQLAGARHWRQTKSFWLFGSTREDLCQRQILQQPTRYVPRDSIFQRVQGQ